MKKLKPFLGMAAVILFMATTRVQERIFPKLIGPYLGQKPPGMTPEVFAAGAVSRQLSVHSAAIFSPDGNEMYWTVMKDPEPIKIFFMKRINEVWASPKEVPFSGSGDNTNPFFSTDGNNLYFKSTRENGNSIWYVQREGNRWSEPVNLGAPFQSGGLDWQASMTRTGTIYFAQALGGFGSHDIYKADRIDGKYPEAVKLGPPINSDIDDWQVFIDPDEEYIVFGRYRQPDPDHQNGLHVSFREKDGAWSDPVNMGRAINGEHGAYWPYVSPDKKHFFFVSDMDNGQWRYDVYWVDANIIEKLRLKESRRRSGHETQTNSFWDSLVPYIGPCLMSTRSSPR